MVLKMLLANEIAEFLKQLYLKKMGFNQPDIILHVDGDYSRNINCDLNFFLLRYGD